MEEAPFDGELRVLIVADDPLARAGLARLLQEQPGFRVVSQEAGQPATSEHLTGRLADVVVWDLGWDPPELPPAFADLEALGAPVVALLPDETLAAAARTSGVRGLIRRDAGAVQLTAALWAVAEGLLTEDPSLAAPRPAAEPGAAAPVEDLTPRELQVLQLLAEGLSNRAIAQQLEISEHTVKFHLNAIFGKLGVQSRTEAAVQAARLGLILL